MIKFDSLTSSPHFPLVIPCYWLLGGCLSLLAPGDLSQSNLIHPRCNIHPWMEFFPQLVSPQWAPPFIFPPSHQTRPDNQDTPPPKIRKKKEKNPWNSLRWYIGHTHIAWWLTLSSLCTEVLTRQRRGQRCLNRRTDPVLLIAFKSIPVLLQTLQNDEMYWSRSARMGNKVVSS